MIEACPLPFQLIYINSKFYVSPKSMTVSLLVSLQIFFRTNAVKNRL